MTTKVRFAPSPTGYLHAGNLRVALINWLYARQQGGEFLLRLDDTDEERSTAEFEDAIQEDLTWCGLIWDSFVRQRDRYDRYALAVEQLKASGRLYACYETAEELELKRKLQLARHKPPVYDREGLHLSAEKRRAYEAEGRRPHWRFKLQENVRVVWQDLVRGEVGVDLSSVSDPVLVRADGTYLYTLPSVVDDVELHATHVLRGEDHVTNTAVQIQIYEALGDHMPTFGHFPLLVGAHGEALSKRTGSLSLRTLREEGFEPMSLLSLLARLGTSDPVEAHASLDELVAGFNIAHFGRATAKFDVEELKNLNAKVLHAMPFAAVRDRLTALGVDNASEQFWLAVRPNLAFLKDAQEWARVVNGPQAGIIEDENFLAEAGALLPPEPWDHDTWHVWTARVKEKTGAKGKSLFLPLRKALTGHDHGPDLSALLPLIGRDRAAKRLRGEAA